MRCPRKEDPDAHSGTLHCSQGRGKQHLKSHPGLDRPGLTVPTSQGTGLVSPGSGSLVLLPSLTKGSAQGTQPALGLPPSPLAPRPEPTPHCCRLPLLTLAPTDLTLGPFLTSSEPRPALQSPMWAAAVGQRKVCAPVAGWQVWVRAREASPLG